jgi:hypothetical protein
MLSLGYKRTGNHSYIDAAVIAAFRRTEKAVTVQAPKVARETLRRIAFIEYLFMLREVLLVNFFMKRATAFVRERPFLKKIAFKILGRDG